MNKILSEMSVDHPYYCSESNYYSNEAGAEWETMTEFLDEFEDADIDMNLIFRWDVENYSSDDEGKKAGRYCAKVFIMAQRKGIFSPHYIKHVNEQECLRFKSLAEKHWRKIKDIWAPISEQQNQEPRSDTEFRWFSKCSKLKSENTELKRQLSEAEKVISEVAICRDDTIRSSWFTDIARAYLEKYPKGEESE